MTSISMDELRALRRDAAGLRETIDDVLSTDAEKKRAMRDIKTLQVRLDELEHPDYNKRGERTYKRMRGPDARAAQQPRRHQQ